MCSVGLFERAGNTVHDGLVGWVGVARSGTFRGSGGPGRPAYKGPAPGSTVWYRLDKGTWVPAVYVHVDTLSSGPAC
jgi:hypothetical protein